MNCPRTLRTCPRASGCPGASDPAVCTFWRKLREWCTIGDAAQLAAWALLGPPGPSKALLAAVAGCVDRGGTLPVSYQPECGCGGELTECRAGKGATPGRVTLANCLDCRRQALGIA